MDDTMSHAPPLSSSLVYHWLWHNGPHFGCWLNRKKTITLVPNIEGLGVDERDDGASPPPKIESPLQPYSAVRHTLHLLRTGAAEYAQHTKQLGNIRKQSTRAPPPTLLWRKLPATPPVTLR